MAKENRGLSPIYSDFDFNNFGAPSKAAEPHKVLDQHGRER